MKVSRNASDTEFFTRYGGTNLLSDSGTKKYSGRIPELYKKELEGRIERDVGK